MGIASLMLIFFVASYGKRLVEIGKLFSKNSSDTFEFGDEDKEVVLDGLNTVISVKTSIGGIFANYKDRHCSELNFGCAWFQFNNDTTRI